MRVDMCKKLDETMHVHVRLQFYFFKFLSKIQVLKLGVRLKCGLYTGVYGNLKNIES